LLGKRFRIGDELIGVGSFGRTHVGIDFKKQTEVAIKIVIILCINLVVYIFIDAEEKVDGFVSERSNCA
jgi:hypothetical protein